MATPTNLAEALESFGNDRVYRGKSRKNGSTQTRLVREWCVDCDKWGYLSKEAARIVISRMLREGVLMGEDTFCFAPYQCPRSKLWHNGHDAHTKQLIKEAGSVDENPTKVVEQPIDHVTSVSLPLPSSPTSNARRSTKCGRAA